MINGYCNKEHSSRLTMNRIEANCLNWKLVGEKLSNKCSIDQQKVRKEGKKKTTLNRIYALEMRNYIFKSKYTSGYINYKWTEECN